MPLCFKVLFIVIIDVNHLIGPKSCLCDACFRSIEKRSTKKKFTKTVCIILTCPNQATHIFKSEWVDKIKKLLNNIGVCKLYN